MNNLKLIFASVFVISLFACGGSGTSDSKNTVCIWDGASLKENPEESGKWICSLSIGEVATFLGKTKEVKTDKKTVSFIKIKLKDGQEGWVQNDFAIINSKPAVLVENAEIYSRPDLLNKTAKTFGKMDILAVKSEQDGFLEVVGKRKGGKWIETGWIKPKSISYDQVDIAVAKFINKAMEISDTKKREEALNAITNNADFGSSVFIPDLKLSTSDQSSDTASMEGED